MGIPDALCLPHVESHWDDETQTWSDPVVVESPYLKIHGLCPALNYGQQAFEGMKAFRNEKGEVRVFRCNDHGARFRNSAMYISVPGVPDDKFSKCIHAMLRHNRDAIPLSGDGSFIYLRPLLIGSEGTFIPGIQKNFTFCVFGWPYKPFMGREPLVAQIEEKVDHAATRGHGQAKIGGNYAPMVRWSVAAQKQGFTTSLFLDSQSQKEIEEFTFSGFVGVKKTGDSYTLVGTNCDRVVKSITADSCYQIARSLGWKVEIRGIHVSELATFDEIISAGTASSVIPVGSITKQSTGEKYVYLSEGRKIGPATAIIETIINGVQQGTIEDTFGWTTLVDVSVAPAKEESKPAEQVVAVIAEKGPAVVNVTEITPDAVEVK